MWQTLVILLLLAGVLFYVIRHYIGIFRGESSGCSCCSGCCGPETHAKDECPEHRGHDAG